MIKQNQNISDECDKKLREIQHDNKKMQKWDMKINDLGKDVYKKWDIIDKNVWLG